MHGTSSDASPSSPASFGQRLATGIYGIACYAVFLLAYLYAIGFLANAFVPKSVDSGAVAPLSESLLVNSALLSLFAIQHSGMARPAFKQWLTRFVPHPIERSTYVLLTSLILLLLYWQWRPLPDVIWHVESPTVSTAIWTLFGLGWVIVLISTFFIDHFDLFGLRQSLMFAAGRPYSPPVMRTPALYRVVRHPIMFGFLIAFWATPHMTWGHLQFAAMASGYIAVGVWLEERDLRATFGESYEAYRREVPAIIPFLGSGRKQSH